MKQKINNLLNFIFVLFYLASRTVCQDPFCSSVCAGHIGACFGPNYNECWACAASFYLLHTDANHICQPKAQHQPAFYELKNNAMDISGYQTSKPVTQICSQYTLSGAYVAGDYIQKTFTSIPTNHYQLVLRFGVGYIGTWASTDQLSVDLDG